MVSATITRDSENACDECQHLHQPACSTTLRPPRTYRVDFNAVTVSSDAAVAAAAALPPPVENNADTRTRIPLTRTHHNHANTTTLLYQRSLSTTCHDNTRQHHRAPTPNPTRTPTRIRTRTQTSPTPTTRAAARSETTREKAKRRSRTCSRTPPCRISPKVGLAEGSLSQQRLSSLWMLFGHRLSTCGRLLPRATVSRNSCVPMWSYGCFVS